MGLAATKTNGVSQELEVLNRHRSHFLLHLSRVDHYNRIPRASVQEAPIRPFAKALLASNAKNGIDLNASEWRMILVRHPEHAVFNGTIFHAGGRPGTPGTALGDDGEFFGFLLARRGKPFGLRFKFKLVRHHPDGLGGSPRCGRHALHYSPKAPSAEAVTSADSILGPQLLIVLVFFMFFVPLALIFLVTPSPVVFLASAV